MKNKIIMLLVILLFVCAMAGADTGKYNLIKGEILTICDHEKAGATSTLSGSAKEPDRYEPNKLFDGDIKTAWAEGDKGPGIDVQIIFAIPTPGHSAALKYGAKQINIINGLASSKELFLANNRIKKFVLALYVGIDTGVDENYCCQYALNLYDTKTFELKDTMDKQSIKIDIDFTNAKDFWRRSRDTYRSKGNSVFQGEYGRYLFGVLIIKSVYKGSKYDDTCISEISFE
ncbi:MAG: hypothetical protein JXN64_07095 [Spirochaetes bacterium]|nr:hypothetical protein [Spirochaetota bacterium]